MIWIVSILTTMVLIIIGRCIYQMIKQNTKPYVLLGVLAPICFFFLMPILINESYKQNGGYATMWYPNDVLSFYGTIISALSTIAAFSFTIYYTNKLNKEEYEKQRQFVLAEIKKAEMEKAVSEKKDCISKITTILELHAFEMDAIMTRFSIVNIYNTKNELEKIDILLDRLNLSDNEPEAQFRECINAIKNNLHKLITKAAKERGQAEAKLNKYEKEKEVFEKKRKEYNSSHLHLQDILAHKDNSPKFTKKKPVSASAVVIENIGIMREYRNQYMPEYLQCLDRYTGYLNDKLVGYIVKLYPSR